MSTACPNEGQSDKKVLQNKVKAFLHNEWVIDPKANPLDSVHFTALKSRQEIVILDKESVFLALVPWAWVQEKFDLPLPSLKELFS